MQTRWEVQSLDLTQGPCRTLPSHWSHSEPSICNKLILWCWTCTSWDLFRMHAMHWRWRGVGFQNIPLIRQIVAKNDHSLEMNYMEKYWHYNSEPEMCLCWNAGIFTINRFPFIILSAQGQPLGLLCSIDYKGVSGLFIWFSQAGWWGKSQDYSRCRDWLAWHMRSKLPQLRPVGKQWHPSRFQLPHLHVAEVTAQDWITSSRGLGHQLHFKLGPWRNRPTCNHWRTGGASL